MKLYSSNDNYKLYQGNMLDMLDIIESNSIDSIITDPPYGLTSITKRFGKEGSAPASTKNNDGSFARLSKGFMGKEWDGSGIEYNVDTWQKCYEVLKPGGYLLAFGGSRTFHRIACAIEDAGFEIRDTIMWLYGSGFPKSMNIGLAIDKKNGVESIVVGKSKSGSTSKAFNLNEQQREAGTGILAGEYDLKKAQNKWNGWGTALKPSFEPIIIARKPFKGSLVDNVIKNGVGGINIDECRVGNEERQNQQAGFIRRGRTDEEVFLGTDKNRPKGTLTVNGRFPANTILTYDETDFDEVCGGFPNTKSQKTNSKLLDIRGNNYNNAKNNLNIAYERGYTDSGSASRYFYCAKASKKDRDCNGIIRNIHPTCKPCNLMQYLVRLVTPNGGTILDPFNGSGSTGKAVMYENKERNKNYKYIGIELTEEYLPIAKARIEYVCNLAEEEKNEERQLSIYDL